MSGPLLGLPYNKQAINDFWTTPYIHENEYSMEDNNSSNNLSDPSFILLSQNCLDLNYKSKRQRLAEQKEREKLNILPVVVNPRTMPIVAKLEHLSSIMTLSDFNLTSQLGKGSFGVVYAAEYIDHNKRNSPRKLAIKIIQINSHKKHKEQLYNSFQAELNVKGLKHPNIIAHLGYNECDLLTGNAFILYELCGTMNLKQFLIDADRTLTISRRKTMSMDLIKAIEFIHMNNIVHMDVKPANIIVTNNSICKLTDFGCSIRINKAKLFGSDDSLDSLKLNEYEDNRWTAGTWFYRAPELFRGDKAFIERNNALVTFKCDIYSLGIVMWQLLTRESPYSEYHEDPQVIVYQIVSKNLRPKFAQPSNLSETSQNNLRISPLVISKSSNSLSSSSSCSSLKSNSSYSSLETLDKNSIRTKTDVSNVNPDILANTKSSSCLNFKASDKPIPSNSEFERVYRNLIELSWSNDPSQRYDAKQLKEVLANTKISY